jgi:hypothetical protein
MDIKFVEYDGPRGCRDKFHCPNCNITFKCDSSRTGQKSLDGKLEYIDGPCCCIGICKYCDFGNPKSYFRQNNITDPFDYDVFIVVEFKGDDRVIVGQAYKGLSQAHDEADALSDKYPERKFAVETMVRK